MVKLSKSKSATDYSKLQCVNVGGKCMINGIVVNNLAHNCSFKLKKSKKNVVINHKPTWSKTTNNTILAAKSTTFVPTNELKSRSLSKSTGDFKNVSRNGKCLNGKCAQTSVCASSNGCFREPVLSDRKRGLQPIEEIRKDPCTTCGPILKQKSVNGQEGSVIKATGPNGFLSLQPNGTGFLSGNCPTATSTGGDLRGAYAVDFQLCRDESGQVASGTKSFIGGGQCNSALGAYTSVVGGQKNQAGGSGTGAFVGGGQYNVATGVNSVIVGGSGNKVTSTGAFIGAGINNGVTGAYSSIISGTSNEVSGISSSVICGSSNRVGLSASPSHSVYNSFIGGGSNNILYNRACTILSGFDNRHESYFTGQFTGGVILGGYRNVVGGFNNVACMIGIGRDNIITGTSFRSVIVSGHTNTIEESSTDSVIIGGRLNTINDTTPGGAGHLIGSGWSNTITDSFNFGRNVILSGGYNVISNGHYSIIGSGRNNTVQAPQASILSGRYNQVLGNYSTIVSGNTNYNTASSSFIGSGTINSIMGGTNNTIPGGQGNSISTGSHSTISGGRDNIASASYATVSGGRFNIASGTYSFIAGSHNNTAAGTSSATIGGNNLAADHANSVVIGGYNFSSNAVDTISLGGIARIKTVVQNDSQTNILAWNSTTYDVEWRDSSTLGGGGSSTHEFGLGSVYGIQPVNGGNTTSTDYAMIAGGQLNMIGGIQNYNASILGGYGNYITGNNFRHSAIGGGIFNAIGGTGPYNNSASVISGGWGNTITSAGSDTAQSIIGGGYSNYIRDDLRSSILGGVNNAITDYGRYNSIGGGRQNTIRFGSFNSTISGGYSNDLDYCFYSNINGGRNHSMYYARYCAIAGGQDNYMAATWGFIGGGRNNRAVNSSSATIGGRYLEANHDYSVVLGGTGFSSAGPSSVNVGGYLRVRDVTQNDAQDKVLVWDDATYNVEWRDASTLGSTGAGGSSPFQSGPNLGSIEPVLGGNDATTGDNSTIAGGINNAFGSYGPGNYINSNCLIGSGNNNYIYASYVGINNSVISGGLNNLIQSENGSQMDNCIIGCGSSNRINSSSNVSIIGGSNNIIGDTFGNCTNSSIIGGNSNLIGISVGACIIGGLGHEINNTANYSGIIMGSNGYIGSNSLRSVIVGGNNCDIRGCSYSGIINGRNCNMNNIAGFGSFCTFIGPNLPHSSYTTTSPYNIVSTAFDIPPASHQVQIRAEGGFIIYTTADGVTGNIGVALSPGSTAWESISDKRQKHEQKTLNLQHHLEKINNLNIEEWSYIEDENKRRHIGPYAQEIWEQFGVGSNPLTVDPINLAGISLAGIKALYQEITELKKQVKQLQIINKLNTPLTSDQQILEQERSKFEPIKQQRKKYIREIELQNPEGPFGNI